ncbi:MAG: hypothetical protein OEV43_03070 [Coriobacteriia bacterium]|nr:hypothetical protein [Coriobacteriia bacterium]
MSRAAPRSSGVAPAEVPDANEPSGLDPALALELPRFNWGAFFIPPLWGLAHGQWPAILFLPAWVFVDNMIRKGGTTTVWAVAIGWGMLAVTVALQAVFATHANQIGYSRVAHRMSVGEFARRERVWAAVGAATLLVMVAWIVMFLARG